MPQATPAAVRKQIAAGTADALYLILGEDEIDKSALAGGFAEIVDEGLRAFNVERMSAGDWTTGDRLEAGVGDLVAAVRTLPMMVARRIVILTQADNALAPKRESEAAERARAAFEALVERPEAQTTLVLVASKADERTKIFKAIAKHGVVVKCGVIEDGAAAQRWIRERVAQAGAAIEPAAAKLMADRAGTDVKRLRAETDRLLLYALGQKTITVADARELAGPEALQDEWGLANAIEAGDAADALRQLALMLDAGAAPEQLLGQLGWVVRAKFPQVAPARVAAGVEAVFRTDLDLKRSSRSTDQPRMLLERLVVELCGGKRQAAWGGRRY